MQLAPWIVLAVDRDRWRIVSASPGPLTIDVFDGCGFAPSFAVWRIAGRVLRIEKASRA